MSTVPQIVTERLVLRGHCAADHSAATDLWHCESVYRYITGEALTPQDVWMRLLRYGGLWDLLGYGYWAVEERASGRYVGQMGFADFKRGLVGFDGRYPEAGWVIHPDVAGRGYATEGMLAACAWLDSAQGSPPGSATGSEYNPVRSFCIIGPENHASIRVAEKLGYRFAMDTRFGQETTSVYFRNSGAGAMTTAL